jgi:hypothetical protein
MEAAFKPDDDGLVVLYDLGYDNGKYQHIQVQMGMVDVRTLRSETNNKNGYQRLLNENRKRRLFKINELIRDYHPARFDPITISIRNGYRNVIDGQGRLVAIKFLYNKGKLSSPMIPCKILQNATYEDEAMLFATQNDGQVQVNNQEKTKAKIIGNDEKTIIIKNMLLKNKLDFGFNNGSIQAYKTVEKLYDEIGVNRLDRIFYVISEAWDAGQVKNSTSADILKGLAVFYKNYYRHIVDDSFVQKLTKVTPDAVKDSYKSYDVKIEPNRKYLKTFSMIYNANRKAGKINYV